MPYDPTKPQENTPLDAAEMRSQFNALKQLIDDLQTQLAERPTSYEVQQMILAQSAGSVTQVGLLNQNVSDPPTQAEVQTVSSQLDTLILVLKREVV